MEVTQDGLLDEGDLLKENASYLRVDTLPLFRGA